MNMNRINLFQNHRVWLLIVFYLLVPVGAFAVSVGDIFYIDGDSGTENCVRLQKSFPNFLYSSHALYGVWLLIFMKGADANEISFS